MAPEAAAKRDKLVNSIGNLTLVTKSLNGSLSNRPWTDAEATGLKEGGEVDKGKRTLLDAFSLLVLNKQILRDHVEAWTEDDILARSEAIAAAISEVWPGPSAEVQEAAYQASTMTGVGPLPEVPWTLEDVKRLAGEAGETLIVVLDTLAAHPGENWTNGDFVEAGLTKWAFAALGALTNKVHGSFARSNVPVTFQQSPGTWAWSLPDDFAAVWRAARGL